MCPDEGLLQAFLDGELDVAQAIKVAGHLRRCAACRERAAVLEEVKREASSALEVYRRATASVVCPRRVPQKVLLPSGNSSSSNGLVKALGATNNKVRRVRDMVFKHKWASGLAVAALALIFLLGWTPGRTLASQFLSIFRMEKVQVVKFTPQDVAELERLLNGQAGEVDIENFGQVEVTQPGQRLQVIDPSRIAELTGLEPRIPEVLAGMEREEILVDRGMVIKITPDVEKINAYLQEHGNVLLPESLKGQSFVLKVPPAVEVRYKGPVELLIAGDLTIEAPAGVDVPALRQALLGLPLLPDNLRRQLGAIDDWQHTLPIPDTQDLAAREVTVNGNQGVYVSRDDKSRGVLVWRQDNSWWAIEGLPLEEALKAAAEVK
ncbi:zf-HC2 domain-containing protein [Moorellaceae bacterium AZ2]